ncbi:MAG TPA: prepilin peptidase [Nevskiaceae bacterium]|nr:prepilin peptidase [Nevskiaceae bacterium]
MIVLLLIVLGLVFGSFVNAFVWRVHEGKDWVRGRSECPHCHHQLAGKDLVPFFSWLALGGKCRYCHHKIEDSPLVELVTPLLFVISYAFWPEPLHGAGLFQFVLWLVFLVGFVALAVYDLRWFLLPDKVVYPLIALAAVQVLGLWLFYNGRWQDVLGAAAGAAIISGVFYVLFQISKGTWIGGGDVKLGVVLGLLAGGPLESLLLLFAASLTGTVLALPFLVQGKAHRATPLPFGPLLIFGLVVVRLFGADLIDWYTHLLVV